MVPRNLPPIQVMQNTGQSYLASNLGVQSHHISLPIAHSHQEMSWTPVLPPPPSSSQGQTPPFHPPPPPTSGSGFIAHSTLGNYPLPSITLPPLPSSPPPIPPSPPPPPITSASSHHSQSSTKVSCFEFKAVASVVASHPSGIAPVHTSDPNQDSGSHTEVAIADTSVILDLHPPPPHPTEEKTLQNTESQSRHLAVDSSGKQYHMHVAIESADSDMEIEDDITLSDKDEGSNFAIEALTQKQDRVSEVFSTNEIVQQLQNSIENDPAKNIVSSGASCSGSVAVRIQHEGPRLLPDLEHVKSVTEYYNPVNDSTKGAEFPQGTVLMTSASSTDNFTGNGVFGLDEASIPDRDSGQLMTSGTPIRLLQDYASDDTSDNEDEKCGADANVLTVSAGAALGVSVAQKDYGTYLETDNGSKSPSSNLKGFGLLSKTYQIDSEMSPHSVQEFKKSHNGSVSRWNSSDGCIEHNLKNQVAVNFATSVEAFHGKDELRGTGIDSGSKWGTEQEDERKASKLEPNILKVDEFGRQPREGPAHSDSDDSRYCRTARLNKRDRSCSRSRSPRHRRSRRRSPRRRKGRRSRSHSWSPRHRRSRSKSPILRRSGGFGGEIVKREKGRCFDFFRGKCYRGASCRYIHQESDKDACSRRYRNKDDLDLYSRVKNSGTDGGVKNISSSISAYEHDEVRSHGVDLCQNVTAQKVEHRKEDSVRHAAVSITFGLDSQFVSDDPVKSESFGKVAPKVQETLVVREEHKIVHENGSSQKAVDSHQQQLVDDFQPEALSGVDALKPTCGTYEDAIPLGDDSFVQKMQSNVSFRVSEHSTHTPQFLNVSFVSDSSSDKRSIISATASMVSNCTYMLPSTQQQSGPSSVGLWLSPEQSSLHSQPYKEIHPHSSSSRELPLHTYQLPPPPPVVSHSQGKKVVHMPPIPREYGVMQQNALFPFQFTSREKFEHYPAQLRTQNFHLNLPPSGTSLPLPPPSLVVNNSSFNSAIAESYMSAEFNQSQLHSTDFVSHTSVMPGLPSHSQSSEFQDQAYTSMQDHSRSFMLREASSPKHLPQGNPESQSLSGANLSRDDLYKQLRMQDSKFSSSTCLDGPHPQSKQFSWESDANRLQPSLDGKLPPEHFKKPSHSHPSSQQQQSSSNFPYSASGINLRVPGECLTVSKFPPDVMDSNLSTSLPGFGGSRISAHYNPYASTFEKPLNSKFSSSICRQENDIIHGNNYGFSGLDHTPITREGVGTGGGSSHSASSPKSARAAGQMLPRSGGNLYDPLSDCIEPSSSSLKKFNFDQKQEVTGESNISLRPKSSYLSLDMEEKKEEEAGAIASTTSQTNDEYGETEDAEAGAIENETLSNHVDVANMATEGVEINQVKSPGKKKRSKDSRSMKLFKISIANFVKEVLKPSWRQGNMSKVAFKTIVKKTVDKVSGAMKGHHVPKSQVKISQYIDSSQRKLTKLVMGYVDKYVKV
ncbi:hypothetical protein RIF29_10083 [Crotalaria pallida]|uniref:C3H1-type domain-containing protein n=1 Tax=Crotalaria pallida TaxID=3830 RepID=A0AAN9IKP9_CROPI